MILCVNCQDRPRAPQRSRCMPCNQWWYSHGTERPRTLPYQPRPPRDALCANCGQRRREYGSVRCASCRRWYYSHGHTERPAAVYLRQRFHGPCSVCGWATGPWAARRCARCAAYWYRRGVDRPARLDQLGTRRPCQHHGCATVTRRLNRGWCSRHYMAAWRRFGHLWRLRREIAAYDAAAVARRASPAATVVAADFAMFE